MRNWNLKAVAGLILSALGQMMVLSSAANAEQLPIKTYTIADGLVGNKISRIVRDSRGFLWFCTQEGLSRYDGYNFTNYTTQQGLPTNWIDDFLETRSGVFLVATGSGLCVFDPKGEPLSQGRLADQPNAKPMFTNYRPNTGEPSAAVKVLYEDSMGNIWCGTNRGLFRVEIADGQAVYHELSLDIPISEIRHHRIQSIVEQENGVLGILTNSALFRRFRDGSTERVPLRNKFPLVTLMDMVEDPDGTLWVSSRTGLWNINQAASDSHYVAARKYASREGLSCVEMTRVYQDRTGRLWAGTDYGLFEFLKKEKRFRLRLGVNDLKDARIWSFNEDRAGNLWIGTANGAIRLARKGFATFTESDGLGFRDVYHITEPSPGEISLYTRFGDLNFFVDRFNGERFNSLRVVPQAFRIQAFHLYQRQIPIRDHLGEWWWPTRVGLFRYGKSDRIEDIIGARPIAHYTIKDGLPAEFLGSIYEDRSGDIWIIVVANIDDRIVRWERATGRFHVYSSADGLPARASPVSVCEDGSGNLWIGFFEGRIARYNGRRFTTFAAAEGVPQGEIGRLYPDSQGRIWITSNGGLGKIEDVSADRPRITTYTTTDGLASDSIRYIAEDRANQFYVATNLGLNHVNFDTGGVKRFTTNDGLANNQVDVIFRDSRGAFWFGTVTGVSRLLPAVEEPPASAPPIFINALKIAGDSRRISEIGETDIQGPALSPSQNQIEIGFGSLAFGPGDSILYRHKLEGADEDWQPLTAQRTVNFANLAPGDYRFLVQAVDADGVMSESPGTFSFRILPPVWQRWWVLALAGCLLCLAVYSTYRFRLTQKLKVERVRTRIATDLHDDIGTNLSLIAMASEVARGRASKDDQRMTEALSLISGTSRELVDSMSDIVWAVNPKKDRLVDLTQRMRRFASDLFSARSIAFHFEAPSDDRDIRLGTETRREVLLIFKEAVSNIARHSECTRADIELKTKGGVLVMKLSDNGKGFDTGGQFDGNGLVSMGQRADRMGGRLEVVSRNGEGTTVTLKTSLK